MLRINQNEWNKYAQHIIMLLQCLCKYIYIFFHAIKATLTAYSNIIHHLPMILLRKKV